MISSFNSAVQPVFTLLSESNALGLGDVRPAKPAGRVGTKLNSANERPP